MQQLNNDVIEYKKTIEFLKKEIETPLQYLLNPIKKRNTIPV